MQAHYAAELDPDIDLRILANAYSFANLSLAGGFLVCEHKKGERDEIAAMLQNLGAMLLSGRVEVVDCSGILGPETPLLKLPPDFAKAPPRD